MKTVLKMILVGASGVALSACGSSGGDDGPTLLSFADLSAERSTLETEANALTLVDSDDLPTSGSATYDGTLGFSIDAGTLDILSDLSITATFQAVDGTLSGNLTNFVNSNEQAYSGQMAIQNGVIDRDASPGLTAFEADVVGSITNTVSGRTLTTATSMGNEPFIQGDFVGEVSGQPPSHIEGIITGALEDTGGLIPITGGSLVGKR